MQKFLDWIDRIAETNHENKLALWLERVAFIFLVLMVLSAPHSIAATQTAWISGMLALVIRLFVKPRLKLVRTPLDLPLLAFFVWSVVTAFTSYAPDISLDKLRGVGLFLIFYFVVIVVRTKSVAVFLAFALVFSCMFNVVWTPIERLIGRGVEIHGVRADSPLTKTIYVENNNEKITLKDGDAVLEVNKKKVRSPEDLLAALEQNETSRVRFYRPDYYLTVQIKRADLLGGANAAEKLGFAYWKKSRNWRSMGFYGHWTTYAEVLQLIASLVFGLFITSLLRKRGKDIRRRGDEETENQQQTAKLQSLNQRNKSRLSPFLFFSSFPFLLFCLAAMSLALLLNVTRASQLAFLVSAISIVLIAGNRKLILISAAVILPVALGGLIFLQQSRNVGFFDSKDDSTKYRQTVYREGFDLWTDNARHFFVGVGMDSIKRYAKDWQLFDDGRLPMGHFHSTPLQLVVERGFPALLLWLWILGVYARTLFGKIQDSGFRILDSESSPGNSKFGSDWKTHGILLGCFGGLIGFFTSGLVHYNLGDAEVAMVFFLLMGISVSLKIEDLEFKITNRRFQS
jgi:O-antigen ligase